MNVKDPRIWLAVGILAIIVFLLLRPVEPEIVKELQVEIARELGPEQIVSNWLECEECFDGELQAVIELGEEAVPILLEILEGGPPPEIIKEAVESLVASYRAVLEYAEKHPELEMEIPQSEGEYVFFYIGNLYAQYASRASIAITAIGEPESLKEFPGLLFSYAQEFEREDLIDLLEAGLENISR